MKSKRKNTIYNRKSDLDQFYTAPEIAKMCYDKIWEKGFTKSNFDIFLEPSAGTGVFLKLMPKSKRIGLDLAPKDPEIKVMDFFDWKPPENSSVITIGNPPFGKMSSLAIKFFNHAAEFSEIIAFIVPLTFRKASVQDKLNLGFSCVRNMVLPKDAFLLDGTPYDVPCCFQIWQKSSGKRRKSGRNFN